MTATGDLQSVSAVWSPSGTGRQTCGRRVARRLLAGDLTPAPGVIRLLLLQGA